MEATSEACPSRRAAIQTNSVGHAWRFPAAPVDPDFWWFGAGARTFYRKRLFHLERGLTSGLGEGKAALSPPYSAC
jgi:hypothetical protein